MAGYPGAERGVVGAHIGVVGADEKASDQKIMHAIGGGGEREQRADAHQHQFALAGFRRRGLARAAGAAAGLSVAGFVRRRRLGVAARDGFFRKMGAKLARRVPRKRRARPRPLPHPAPDEGCVRPGLSLRPLRPPHYNTMSRYQAQPNQASPSPLYLKLALTERFGQGIFYPRHHRPRVPSEAFPAAESFSEKLNQWLQPILDYPRTRRRRGQLEAPSNSRWRQQGLHGSRL